MLLAFHFSIVIELSVTGIGAASFIVKKAFIYAITNINTETFFEDHEQGKYKTTRIKLKEEIKHLAINARSLVN